MRLKNNFPITESRTVDVDTNAFPVCTIVQNIQLVVKCLGKLGFI